MSRKMKYLGAAAIGLVLCITAFLGGFQVGSERVSRQTSIILVGSNALDQRTVLRMLENSDVEAAKKYLNSSIDADVLHLQALVASAASSDLTTRSQQVLEMIATDRKGHPTEKNHVIPEVDQRVKSILDEAAKNQASNSTSH